MVSNQKLTLTNVPGRHVFQNSSIRWHISMCLSGSCSVTDIIVITWLWTTSDILKVERKHCQNNYVKTMYSTLHVYPNQHDISIVQWNNHMCRLTGRMPWLSIPNIQPIHVKNSQILLKSLCTVIILCSDNISKYVFSTIKYALCDIFKENIHHMLWKCGELLISCKNICWPTKTVDL